MEAARSDAPPSVHVYYKNVMNAAGLCMRALHERVLVAIALESLSIQQMEADNQVVERLPSVAQRQLEQLRSLLRDAQGTELHELALAVSRSSMNSLMMALEGIRFGTAARGVVNDAIQIATQRDTEFLIDLFGFSQSRPLKLCVRNLVLAGPGMIPVAGAAISALQAIVTAVLESRKQPGDAAHKWLRELEQFHLLSVKWVVVHLGVTDAALAVLDGKTLEGFEPRVVDGDKFMDRLDQIPPMDQTSLDQNAFMARAEKTASEYRERRLAILHNAPHETSATDED